MSSGSISQRKKKRKGNKSASLIPVRTTRKSKNKQKTRLSREFEENEKEVQQLLNSLNFNLNLGSTDSKENNLETQSEEFFCSERLNYTVSLSQSRHSVGRTEAESDASDEISSQRSDGTFAINEQHENALLEEESSGTVYNTGTPEHSISTRDGNQHQTVSTFIQIESAQHDLYTHYANGLKHTYDFNVLYKPNTNLQHDIRLDSTSIELKANTKRMINRFHTEIKASMEKPSKTLVRSLQKSATTNSILSNDPILYRSFCLKKFHPIFCNAKSSPIEIPIRQFIKLYLKELRFTQHRQICDEHIHANELEDLYEEYAKRQRDRIAEKLERNLQTERNVVGALMKLISDENSDDQDNNQGCNYVAEQRLQTIQEHLFKVKELRTRLYDEEAYNKRLLKSILDKWLELKKLRQSQEFQCTRFRLRIQVRELTVERLNEENMKWEKRFQADLSEMYREELEIYYSAKRLWKQAKGDIIKPKRPNLSHLTAELKQKYTESFSMPDEPKIDIQRNRVSDEEFYENTKKINTNGNQQRRLGSYFFKIYFDREFVAESRTYRMEPDLSLRINEAIGILLERRLPKEIIIALYEKSRIAAPHKIAKIILPLSQLLASQNDIKAGCPTSDIQFSSKKEPLAGRLYFALKCQTETPTDSHTLRIPVSIEKETANDYRNLETSDEDDEQHIAENETETCTFEETLLQFCSLDDIKSNPRFKLLRSRYLKNDERTRDLCLVPALVHELEFDYESGESDAAVIDTGNWMDPIDLHKHRGKKYVKTLYEDIRNQCARLDKAIESSENLLIGDEPASWSLLIGAFASLFHSGRPLNPNRGDGLQNKHLSSMQWDGTQSFNIILNVVRATGIPVRSYRETIENDYERQRSTTGSSNTFVAQNLKYSNVRPFIAMSYGDKLCRTTAAEGSNPTWNEQLMLQMSGSLIELRDDLKITIFDEIVENQLNDDSSSANIYQRIRTNFLAEYRIPINTIIKDRKLEDNIEFNVPKILLGYKRPSLDSISTSLDTSIVVEIKESVQLFFYLSFEPTFELPSINTKTLECSELLEVRQHLHEWTSIIREMYPHRIFDPLVCTEDGKRVCITRLLEPIPLPFESSENLFDSICRYVAFLSSMKSYDPCMGYRGVWLNNQVLLDTTWGSAKDFGVLLCNFILSLGLNCWLVLGISNTFGESTFVLYKSEDNNLQFLEPCTGKRYFVKDVLSPLCSISYIIAQDNIYCNIQSETRVSMINFNFNDSSCWLPAFGKRNPAPLGGVQSLNYAFHETLSTVELVKNIERKIIKKISSWRTMRKTVWNRAFQSRLYDLLLDLESKSTFTNTSGQLNINYADQIAAEYPTYKLHGFTLNFPYTNLSAISERIRTTGIHLNSDKNVEFSLAVHVHKYPNNVLSVWIFLISIVPAAMSN